MEYTIKNNEQQNRFETQIEGKIALVDYKLFEGGISFLHTEVPEELAGKGIASALSKHVLDYAIEHSLKVKPYCTFINSYIDKHPQYQANSLFHNKD